LAEFQQNHPQIIRLLNRETNVGVNQNVVDVLNACRGRYIALLEGDDYWIDTGKLQRQADFLDAHQKCSIVHHNVLIEAEHQPDQKDRRYGQPPGILSLKHLMRTNPISTCSAMYRNGLFRSFPDWFLKVSTPDWSLHVMNACHGEIGYLDEISAVYRIHDSSYWSSKSRLEHLDGQVRTAELTMACLPPKMRRRLARTVELWREESLELLIHSGRDTEAQMLSDKELADGAAIRRLTAFFTAMELEASQQRIKAAWLLVSTLWTAPRRTRIRNSDVLLALIRVAFPRLYDWTRSRWRKRRDSTHVSATPAVPPCEPGHLSSDFSPDSAPPSSASPIVGDAHK
ncbi:MAG: glycosyltransferase, partial [Planctomycetota bacterium]|nr:glycosyltransferase [Planctomycetota bacterium]